MSAKLDRGTGRERILDAAVRTMDAQGYHGTSMRDVAREAEVTVASIYHHFPSKQDLLQDIMVRVLRDVIAVTRTALIAAGPRAVDQLDAIVYAFARFHTERRAEAQIGNTERRSLDAAGRKIVLTLRDEQAQLFRDVVERGVAVGDFATPYPSEVVRAMLNMGAAIATWYRADGPLSGQEVAQRYVHFGRTLVEVTGADQGGEASEVAHPSGSDL